MDKKIKILLAEDDQNLGLLLKEYLTAKGYQVCLCEDGEIAITNFHKENFDFCILDVMMPKKDGFAVAKDIRAANAEIPIIFLTAKSLKEDIIEGFKLGGDDYMTKPFSIEELLMRIEAILRRSNTKAFDSDKISFDIGSLIFNSKKQLLTQTDGTVEKLTTKESELLRLLCINTNRVLERNVALKAIWIDDNYFNARSMDVYITKLRKHIKSEEGVEIINVHGKGYKLIM
jgi:DNA-binding response OmpR family regulator